MKKPSDATRAAAKDYEQSLLKLMTGYPPDPEVAAGRPDAQAIGLAMNKAAFATAGVKG